MNKLPFEVEKALSLLRKAGFEAYIIGGCVRDRLMGIDPKDYDITTSAEPNETERVFSDYRVIETGIKHGTVTVLINGLPLEITTFRIDSEYSDNRRPDSVVFAKSLIEDTKRRDFTMNAVAMDEKGNYVDDHGGIADIGDHIIRCVGDPDKRFGEDALRILRAIRFSSVLGFEIEERTKAAVFRCKDLLRNISMERIASELTKLICGKDSCRVIVEYADVIGVVIPEISDMKDFEQHTPYHIYDVLEHTAHVVENVTNDPVMRLAALFHDIAKPRTLTITQGVGHFYGHDKLGGQMTESIMKQLKYDNHTKDTVVKIVSLHCVQIENTEAAVKRFMNRHSQEMLFRVLELKKADERAKHPSCLARIPELERIENTAHDILNRKECFSIRSLEINGRDLINIGYKPGKELGSCLNRLLDDVMSGKLKNDHNELIHAAEALLAEPN